MQRIRISTELRDYIERLNFEAIRYKDLLQSVRRDSCPMTDEEWESSLEYFRKMNVDAQYCLNIALEEVYDIYKNIIGNEPWHINFIDCVLVIGSTNSEPITIRKEQYSDMLRRLFPPVKHEPLVINGSYTKDITLQVTDACNMACTYCLVAGTKILLPDFTTKNIEDIVVGDKVLAFPEYPKTGKQDVLEVADVTALFHRTSQVIRVTLDNGSVIDITENHPVLTRRNSYDNRFDFVEAGKLTVGQHVYYVPDIVGELPVIDDDYKIGYLTGIIMGDGSLKKYKIKKWDNSWVYKFRLALKDIEATNRAKEYLDYFNIDTYMKPYKISTKYNLYEDSIFSCTKGTYNDISKMINNNFRQNKSINYFKGYLAGIYDAEGHISKTGTIRICNTDKDIIDEISEAMVAIGVDYTVEEHGRTKNKEYKWNVRVLASGKNVDRNSHHNMNFIMKVNPAISRKGFNAFIGRSLMRRCKVISIEHLPETVDVYNFETTSHTYFANNIAVHNCYQHNKGTHSMSFEVAKNFLDMILDADERTNTYVTSTKCDGAVINFIGGEPWLEIDLITKVSDYFIGELFRRKHPWATRFMFSVCSNGLLHFDSRVQEYIKKHTVHFNYNISIDGNKDLHDACRVDLNGNGTYDRAIAGVKNYRDVFHGKVNSKMTIAPGNVDKVFDAVSFMIEDSGYLDINLNCVYEEGWTNEHANTLYWQLHKLADWLYEQDLLEKTRLSIFSELCGKPLGEKDNQNWCWGAGTPILTTDGYKPIEEVKIGDMVYTEDGTIHPVINTMSHFANNCVNIHVSGAFDLVCTKNHQLFTMPFDHIGNKYVKHYREYGKCAVENIAHKDLIKLFSLPDRNVSYDTNISYLVGRYIGDGWSHYNDKGHSICCAFDETEDLKLRFDEAVVDYGIFKNKTVDQFSIYLSDNINNKELHRILSHCGHTASQKHLPPECFNWDNESLMALLQGYIDADGSVNKDGLTRINTVSHQLAIEIMVILRTLGYTPTCHKNKRAGKSIIQGREVNIKDRYEIYFYEDASRSKYVHKRNGDIWTYGLKMTDVEPQMVYNLTVETNHSYIAGGIVSANCGGVGLMLAVDYKGDIYPCIRYMESSSGNNVAPYIIGNIKDGINVKKEHCDRVNCLGCITRKSQSTEECYNCPIAMGCGWCSGYHYELFGTPNKRATYICCMHKARVLANVYYWRLRGVDYPMNCPKEWAVEIIGEEEYEKLNSMKVGEKLCP